MRGKALVDWLLSFAVEAREAMQAHLDALFAREDAESEQMIAA